MYGSPMVPLNQEILTLLSHAFPILPSSSGHSWGVARHDDFIGISLPCHCSSKGLRKGEWCQQGDQALAETSSCRRSNGWNPCQIQPDGARPSQQYEAGLEATASHHSYTWKPQQAILRAKQENGGGNPRMMVRGETAHSTVPFSDDWKTMQHLNLVIKISVSEFHLPIFFF